MDFQNKVKGEFIGFNILSVEMSDSGHLDRDGRVLIRFINDSCTDMRVDGRAVDEVSLYFGGSSERDTLIAALKFILKELEDFKKGGGVGYKITNTL